MSPLATRLCAEVATLCAGHSRIVVAVSGGPDSQALLAVLGELRSRLGLQLHAVGVDHRLRPEAQTELDLAAALAGDLDVCFARVAVDVPKTGNLQAAARQARYAALRGEAARIGAERIAVGHTQSDQVETILHNLVRGCALRGAGGMRPRRDDIIRPLLSISRDELRAYLHARAIPCAEDPTNADPHFSRVRLRHEILPLLRQLNPRIEASITRFAHAARLDDELLEDLAAAQQRLLRGAFGSLRVAPLTELHPALQRRVLRIWFASHGVPSDAERIDGVLAALHDGAIATSVEGRRLRSDDGALWIEPASVSDPPQALPLSGRLDLPGADLVIRCRIDPADSPTAFEQKATASSQTVAFDADRLHLGLQVRSWRRGDRLRPFGLDGHMRIGDLFTNAKIPILARPSWPVVVHGCEVVWVVGLRRGAEAPVTAATRRVAWLDLVGALPSGAC